MRVLVTGGAGFIGSHLVDALVAADHEVIVADNFHHGRREHLAPFEGNPRLRLVVGDIADPHFVRAALRPLEPHVVYHLAAIHYIPECLEHPTETIRVNVVGTQRLLEALSSPLLARAIVASSGSVYAPQSRAVTEQDPLGPVELYGISKWMTETLWQIAAQETPQATWIVARLFNAYGPRETNAHVIPTIVDHLKSGGPVRLGNLDARRDFTYVADTVSALLALGQYERPGACETFNVGTGVAASAAQVLRTMEDLLGRDIPIIQEPGRERPVERPFLCADITRIRQATGWQPRWTLAEGLRAWLRHEGLLPRAAVLR